MTADHFATLQALGVRVLRCPDFGHDAVYFEPYRLLVVDAGLPPYLAEPVACWALGEATSSV